MNKIFHAAAPLLCGCMMLASCQQQGSSLDARFPDKYEGKMVEMISFADSAILQTGIIKDGHVLFDNSELLSDTPTLVELSIDGRVKAFAVIEPGAMVLADTLRAATGTPLNDRFASLLSTLDSIGDLDDMGAYIDYADRQYTLNKDNALAPYFAVEVIKFAEPSRVDSLLKVVPRSIADSKKAARFIRSAELRRKTSPGNKYVDFQAPGPDGRTQSLSSFIKPGKYTVVDFWASWCPYCIKELPELKALLQELGPKGVEIVGVAVRDKTEDTKNAVSKHGITWPVMYGAQRIPYDIYGFTGIPHLMLIGPDGIIISRGESAEQVAARLRKLTAATKQ